VLYSKPTFLKQTEVTSNFKNTSFAHFHLILYIIYISVAKQHHFYAAMASRKNFDAALSPA
jgi:hypothetical protein